MYPRKDQCNYRSVTQPPFDMKIKYYFLFCLVFSSCRLTPPLRTDLVKKDNSDR